MTKSNYDLLLSRHFYNATGGPEDDMAYIRSWYKGREYMLEEYIKTLYELSNNGEILPSGLLENVVEVGEIGNYNTISPFLQPITVVSPYANMIQRDNCYTGIISVNSDRVSFKKIESSTTLPSIRKFRTFVTQNPDLNIDNTTMRALKSLAWQVPSVVVCEFGSLDDCDRKEKLGLAKIYLNQIKEYSIKYKDINPPTVIERYIESENRTYIYIIITRQNVKPSLLRKKTCIQPAFYLPKTKKV